MRHTSFKSMDCPIARSLERVGEWWSILILRDAFAGMTRFDEFAESLGIAPEHADAAAAGAGQIGPAGEAALQRPPAAL